MQPGNLKYSAFDAAAFGQDFYQVGDAKATDTLAQDISALAAGPGFIVAAKIPADPETEAAYLALGFRRITTQLQLSRAVTPTVGHSVTAAPALSLDDAALAAHARGFRFGRYARDPLIPPEAAERFKRTWIENTLAGRREVLAIESSFVSYREDDDRLEIDLLSSITPRRSHATQLLTDLHTTAALRGKHRIDVITEAENIGALNVYLKAGFRPVAASYAMHLVHAGGRA